MVSKRILWAASKYLLGFGLLAWVIWKYWAPPDSIGIAEALRKPIHWLPVMLAATFFMASSMLTFVRWYVLVRAQELPFTLFNAFRLGLVGFFFNAFLPGSVSGDIVKAVFLVREQNRRTVAISTLIVDRAVGLWGLFWLVALLGLFFWGIGNEALRDSAYLQTIVLISVGIVVFSLACWGLLGILPDKRARRFASRLEHLPKVGMAAAEMWRAVWMYRQKWQGLSLALILAIIGHVGFVLTFFFAAMIFLAPSERDAIPSMVEHFLLVPIGMTFQAVFPAPGGVGGAEMAYGWLYTLVGKLAAFGVLGSLAQRMIMWVLAFAGYLVYLRMRPSMAAIPASPSPLPTPQMQVSEA
ncbi:MAG: lysylphosphatidylglycerol synthase transmembrane domain-containing protein [Gemmataceae bacterium]